MGWISAWPPRCSTSSLAPLQSLDAARQQADLGAAFGEGLNRGAPDSGGRAGDHDNLRLVQTHVPLLAREYALGDYFPRTPPFDGNPPNAFGDHFNLGSSSTRLNGDIARTSGAMFPLWKQSPEV